MIKTGEQHYDIVSAYKIYLLVAVIPMVRFIG
jgi:hypothetical protein